MGDKERPVADAVGENAKPRPVLGALAEVVKRWWAPVLMLSTAAEAVGKVISQFDGAYRTVSGALPYGVFLFLHQSIVPVVKVTLVVGYAGAAFWLFLKVRQGRQRLAFGVPVVTGLLVLGFVNYLILPGKADDAKLQEREREAWVQQVLRNPNANGGVPVTSRAVSEPQVWTTAQVLRGVLNDGPDLPSGNVERVRNAFRYIEQGRLNGRNGWGYFEDWQFGVTEINAWVALAETASLRRGLWTNPQEQQAMVDRVTRDLDTIVAARQPDGGWSPVIGTGMGLSRTYSTIIALWALFEARGVPQLGASVGRTYDSQIHDGVTWLMTHYIEPLEGKPIGWVANPSRAGQGERFLGLNAQALYVLTRILNDETFRSLARDPVYLRAVDTFLAASAFDTNDIDRNDRLHDSDRYIKLEHPGASPAAENGGTSPPPCSCPVTVEGSTFLWFPWSVAAARVLSQDAVALTQEQKDGAAAVLSRLFRRLPEATSFVGNEFNYVAAEFLIGFESL